MFDKVPGAIPIVLFVFLAASASPAQQRDETILIVKLASGDAVRGTIVEDTEEFVVIDKGGNKGPFYDPRVQVPRNEIVSIERPPERIKRIVVHLDGERQLAGELLSVRDCALMISTLGFAEESSEAVPPRDIVGVRTEDIQRITVLSGTSIWKSIGGGFLVGSAFGTIVTLLAFSDTRTRVAEHLDLALLVPGAFGVIGAISGTIIGITDRETDQEIEAPADHNFSVLQSIARYPMGEPAYLTAVEPVCP